MRFYYTTYITYFTYYHLFSPAPKQKNVRRPIRVPDALS